MTQSKEDYLKAIYTAGGTEERVATATIARMLSIAPASVTEMNVKLSNEGLCEYEPYKGVRLTDKGIKEVVNVIRSHELWEVFLTSHLGYTMREAHQEAERLEHATSLLLAERLDEYLNRPSTCPRGSMIPRPGGEQPTLQIERLSDLPVNTEAVIYKLTSGLDGLEEDKKTALKPGRSIALVEKGEKLTAECSGVRYELTADTAEKILVSVE